MYTYIYCVCVAAYRAALQISEGIALERESLVKQLEMLRFVLVSNVLVRYVQAFVDLLKILAHNVRAWCN